MRKQKFPCFQEMFAYLHGKHCLKDVGMFWLPFKTFYTVTAKSSVYFQVYDPNYF